MDRIEIIIIIVIIMIIGFLRILFNRNKIVENHNVVADYLEKFKLFVEKDKVDYDIFSSLLFDSDKVQNILGSYGVCDLRPPFANYLIKNYQIILNAIPEIKKEMEEPIRISNQYISNYADLVNQSLIRFGGSSSEAIKEYGSELRNPIKWLLEGVRFIISLPFEVLLQIGLISERTAKKVRTSFLVKTISSLITLIGLVSAIIGIIVGWEQFVKIINGFL